ncbi:MAG: transporter substrate-binding domain-containing protein [Uliginosibacterium sp.]|nr:transporter substrate-binding domain-containing protein [Uliginosibacterium sp.]
MRTLRATLLAALAVFWAMPCLGEPAPLKIATLDYPPYIVNTDGQASGIVVDIVREAFRRSGQAIEIGFYPWSRSLSLLSTGDVDALFTIKRTAAREVSYRYPKETVISQDYVFFVRKDSKFSFDGSYASIANARIGVVANTSYGARFDEAIRQKFFEKIETAKDYELIFRMLAHDRVDVVICSHLVGLSFLKKIDKANEIIVSGPPSETAYSYLIFTRAYDTSIVSDNFDRAMASMRKDGTISKILKSYK